MDSTITFDTWLSYYVCLEQGPQYEKNLLLPGGSHHDRPVQWLFDQYRDDSGLVPYWRMNDQAVVPVPSRDIRDMTLHELTDDAIYQGVILYPSCLEALETCQEPIDMVFSMDAPGRTDHE